MANSTRLHPLAVDAAKELRLALAREYGMGASREVLVAALLVGTTPEQAVGMLMAFAKLTAEENLPEE
jgi:hypothetical protein